MDEIIRKRMNFCDTLHVEFAVVNQGWLGFTCNEAHKLIRPPFLLDAFEAPKPSGTQTQTGNSKSTNSSQGQQQTVVRHAMHKTTIQIKKYAPLINNNLNKRNNNLNIQINVYTSAVSQQL